MDPSDAQRVFDTYSSDAEAARYMTFVVQTGVSEAAAFLNWQRSQFDERKSVLWAILAGPQREFIGAIEIRIEHRDGVVGFIIGRPYWGNGYTAEALSAVLRFAKDELHLHEVTGSCDVENLRSARVFEKAGFQSTGVALGASLHPNISETPRDARTFVFDLR